MTSHQKVKYVLGVETSCDDTAIGIIDSSKNIKANIVLNQNNYHKEFGGIVPEIAARAHLSFIDIALKKALTRAKIKLEEIDLFCYLTFQRLHESTPSFLVDCKEAQYWKYQ